VVPLTPRSKRSNIGVRLLAVAIAYVVSRVIFAAWGFHYNVFREPLSWGKLAIDFGVWVLIYGSTVWMLQRFEGSRRPPT
jgi:hypothetical protein